MTIHLRGGIEGEMRHSQSRMGGIMEGMESVPTKIREINGEKAPPCKLRSRDYSFSISPLFKGRCQRS